MSERWKPIDGWPGYEVSDHGRLRSCKWRGCDGSWRILRTNHGDRYDGIGLRDGSRPRRYRGVHVLVLEAFVGKRPKGMQAAHNDGDTRNNRLENLRWATPADNTGDKKKHGTQLYGEQVVSAKLTEDEVRQIRKMIDAKIPRDAIAKKFKICKTSIKNIKSGKTWSHVK